MKHGTHPLVRPGAALLVSFSLAWFAFGCGPSATEATLPLQSNPTVVATMGGSSTTAPAGSTTPASMATATVGGVTLDYPEAWLTQANGDTVLTVAQRQEDLSTARPGGPRFVVEVAAGDSADLASVLREVTGSGADAAAAASSAVVADPEQVLVGDKEGALVILQNGSGKQSTVSCYVVVDLDDGRSVALVLEAPAAQWESNRQVLQTILQSVRFR